MGEQWTMTISKTYKASDYPGEEFNQEFAREEFINDIANSNFKIEEERGDEKE